MGDADPGKFTPRTFIQVMSLAGPIIAKGGKANARMINGSVQVGTSVPWQAQALKLIKAEDNEIEKAEDDEFSQDARVEAKEKLLKNKKELKKKDKKKYDALYGKRAIDAFLFGDDDNGEDSDDSDDDDGEETKTTKKAQDIDLGMSLSEAEDLLLG